MRAKLLIRLGLFVLLALVVALVQVVKSIDVDLYRDQLAGWTRRETGRELSFAGPLKFRPSLRPALVAYGVTLADRPGSARAEMVRLDRVEAEVGLLPLLWGEIRIDRILVDGADIFLDEDADGRGNWEFTADPAAGPPASLPAVSIRVSQLAVRNVTVHVRTPADRSLLIDRATLETDGLAAPIALTLDGQWNGRKLSVSGLLGSLRDVFVDGKPLSVRLKALTPGLVASAEGTLRSQPKQGVTVALTMAAELNDSADLDPLIGLPLPSLGSARAAFALSGPLARPAISSLDATVGRHDTLAVSVKGAIADPLAGTGIDLALTLDGDAAAAFAIGGQGAAIPMSLTGHVAASGDGDDRSWRIADIKGTLGRSDLAGQIRVGRHDGHAVVDGGFTSALVDLTRPSRPAAEAARGVPIEGRLFPDDPLPLHILAVSDGHVTWQVTRLADRKLSIGPVSLDVAWREGRLTARAGVDAIAGGRIDGDLDIDAAASPAEVGVDLAVTHVSVGDLLTELGVTDAIQGGRVDLRFKSAGAGDSIRSLMASQRGSSLLSVGPTGVAGGLAGDGLGSILGRLGPTSGDHADLRCLISHFTLADGLARSEALLFAVGQHTVTGQGSVNLANESLDFTLTPRQPGQAPSAPLDVGGTILHPAVTPDRGAIVRSGPGLAVDAVSPLMIFAADGNPCFAALNQGRRPHRPVAGGLR